jgi:uncharacterized surface protein with fasciclin (FAS1) repeats
MIKNSIDRMSATRVVSSAFVAGALAVGLAACGSSPSASTTTTSSNASSTHTSATTHPMAHPMMDTFGTECSMVPASGMGSLQTMSMEPVVTAASHNPLLMTFATDVRTAGLLGTLDMNRDITVFAPSDEAFAMASSETMMMMHNAMEMKKLLEFEVVKGHVTTADLGSGMKLDTLEGSTLTGSKMGSVYEVGTADVVCGNITTANATVYVVNKVLTPMH